ncbi:MAG: hypothetical protein N2260_06735 [Syntrophobacterales bacterium]|nr:hypothetical protein [Syntrophobacterales bacterium]
MKQYIIDQLRESDYEGIKEYLDLHARSGAMEGIYWIDIPKELYTNIQKEHNQCQPFCFAVNLNRRFVGFEFLIRSHTVLRCSCIGYATKLQRDFIIDFADSMIDLLKIKL